MTWNEIESHQRNKQTEQKNLNAKKTWINSTNHEHLWKMERILGTNRFTRHNFLLKICCHVPGVSHSERPEVVCACGLVRSRASKAPERLLPCKCGAEACDAKDLEQWRGFSKARHAQVTWKWSEKSFEFFFLEVFLDGLTVEVFGVQLFKGIFHVFL